MTCMVRSRRCESVLNAAIPYERNHLHSHRHTGTDLIIDGTSFRRLPDRLDPNRAKTTPGNSGVISSTPVRSSSQYNGGSSGGSRTNSYTYNYSNGGGSSGPSSRESSFSPWPCSRCTLVNEKPLAPICEACGAPKPDYICTPCSLVHLSQRMRCSERS